MRVCKCMYQFVFMCLGVCVCLSLRVYACLCVSL